MTNREPRAPLFTEAWWVIFRWPEAERIAARRDLHEAEERSRVNREFAAMTDGLHLDQTTDPDDPRSAA